MGMGGWVNKRERGRGREPRKDMTSYDRLKRAFVYKV